jgi:DNA-directed RNA polymerase alpha subunit
MSNSKWCETIEPTLLDIAMQHSRMVEVAICSGEAAKAHAAIDSAFVAIKSLNQLSLDSPLEVLLPGRIATILRGGGIANVADLLHHTRDSIKVIHQIRYKSIDLIEQKLAMHGLGLRKTDVK